MKDFIAPTSFQFNSRNFRLGGLHCAMSYLAINASEVSDGLLKKILDTESSQVVTMHIHPMEQGKAIKDVKHTITDLDRSRIDEQKKAVRSGYDMDIIPSDLVPRILSN